MEDDLPRTVDDALLHRKLHRQSEAGGHSYGRFWTVKIGMGVGDEDRKCEPSSIGKRATGFLGPILG
jgi:hypothetical protein